MPGPLDHRQGLEEQAAVERDWLGGAGEIGLLGLTSDCHGLSVRRIRGGNIGQVDDVAGPGWVTSASGIGPGGGGGIRQADDVVCRTAGGLSR
jgi:hypothetical protein